MVGACPFPSPQGSQVYMQQMAQALAGYVSLTLVTYAHGEGSFSGSFTHIRLPRFPRYHRMRSGPDPIKPFLDSALVAKLCSLKADVFHAHNYEAGLAALVAGRLTQTPVLYNTHGVLSEELPFYFHPKWSRAAACVGHIADRLLVSASATLAISKAGYQKLSALSPKRLELSLPGLDPVDFQGITPIPGPELVYAGNPDGYQDLPVLFDALRQLPALKLRIVTACKDWPLLKQYPDLLPRIEQVYAPSWQEARHYIAGCRLGMVPRRFCSGFPIKLLNYLGLGLPVVVCHGASQGFKGEYPVEPAEFAAGIKQALSRSLDFDKEQFLKEQSWSNCTEPLLKLYQSLS
jgi:glycosyltransferase involved in cell wall biosynthesis